MTLTQAIRKARSEFPPVRKDRERMWSYETSFEGAYSCASLDYYACVRTKNREIVFAALVLLGWTPRQARVYVSGIDGRGTYYDMMHRAREWRVREAA
jgi:hypothetical protein